MTLETLLAAILMAESGGVANPPDGDGGRSIGPYQIQRAYWADAVDERIAKTWPERYFLCRERGYAEKIVRLYWRRYCPQEYARVAAGKGTLHDCEVLARVHNGGPRGATKAATKAYWRRVQAAAKGK